MSHVTNLILLPHILEKEKAWHPELLRRLSKSGPVSLVQVGEALQDHQGKNLEADVYICALNYFGPTSIHEAIAAVQWEYPWDLCYLIQDQHEDGWSFFRGTHPSEKGDDHAD